MDFSLDRIKDFPSSVSFLTDTMIQSGKYVYQNEGMLGKPFWLAQSEKFSSFYERIKRKEEAIDKLKLDVFKPVFSKYELEFNSKLINDENKVQDEFLKVLLEDEEASSSSSSMDLMINNSRGLYFKAGKLPLPFSETYSQVTAHNKKYQIKNNPYPLLLLVGLYSSIFNAVKEQETAMTNQCFKDNIQILLDGLEGCDGIPKRKQTDNNPMSMLQNMMQSFDFGELSKMMGKVTGDEKAAAEFGEVFGKMTESIKKGDNPLESMGEIIKNVSSRMEDEEDPDVPLVREEEVSVEEPKDSIVTTAESVKLELDPIPEEMMESTTM